MCKWRPDPYVRFRASIDGAARGNPGPAGAGVYVEAEHGRPVLEFYEPLGSTTNNVAEYRALLLALERAEEAGADDVEIRSDSRLLVEQMHGTFKMRAEHLKPLLAESVLRAKSFAARDLAIPRERPKATASRQGRTRARSGVLTSAPREEELASPATIFAHYQRAADRAGLRRPTSRPRQSRDPLRRRLPGAGPASRARVNRFRGRVQIGPSAGVFLPRLRLIAPSGQQAGRRYHSFHIEAWSSRLAARLYTSAAEGKDAGVLE